MIGQSSETRALRRRMPASSPMRGMRHGRELPHSNGLLQPLPGWTWFIAFSGVLWGLTTSYPLLTAACCLSLPLMAGLLYFKGEPPILFACCAMQWLQVATAVFYAGFFGTTMEKAFSWPEMEQATWLSLAGLMALAVGMRSALHSLGRGQVMADQMESGLEKISLGRLHQAWWLTFVIGLSLGALAWKMGSLRQITTPIISIKWVIFFLLAYRVLVRDEGYGYLLVALAVEFVIGFSGYFASFKEVLLMLIIVVMTLRRGVNLRIRGMAVAVVVIGLIASVFWTAIKMDYREYLRESWSKKGEADTMARLEAVKLLVSRTDGYKLEGAFQALVARISYTGLFGATLSHVPAFEPHSGGELWLGAVQHVFMPRIFFPDKKALDDSARARRFTGMRLAGAEEGTSIGIGYMAESYADFGRYGMFFPIYLLGLLMGWIYQNFCKNSHSALLGTAIATGILFTMILAFATSNIKIVGSLIILLLAYKVLNAFFGARFVRWLRRA